MTAATIVKTDDPRPLDPPPPARWFRKRRRTGRIGKWHSPHHMSVISVEYYCKCGVSTHNRYGQFVDWATDPGDEERCNATR